MTVNEVKKLIQSAKNVAIFGHVRPDLDCFGAMFGAKYMCENLGVKAQIFAVNDQNSYLYGIFDKKQVKENFNPKNFDLYLVVDCHLKERIHEKYADTIFNFSNVLIIDHHVVDAPMKIENYFIDHTKCSASIIIFELLQKFKIKITKEVATSIFAGIVGDTSRFLHSNVTPSVFKTASRLMEYGADIQRVYDVMYRSKSLGQVELQKFILNSIKRIKSYCYIIVSIDDMTRLNVDVDDVKFFIDDINQIKDFNAMFLCYETEKGAYKVSCRSKGSVNVQKVSAKYGGGGHKMAAGFSLSGNKEQVEKEIINICGEI